MDVMLTRIIDAIMCKLGRCRVCRLLDLPSGMGGQCVRCGRVSGWMSRDELRAIADRHIARHPRRFGRSRWN